MLNTTDNNNSDQIKTAAIHWAACLTILVILLNLPAWPDSNFLNYLTVIFYLAAGFHLNRTVLRQIVSWHPVYNTLENVSMIKLRYFLFWPVTYLALCFRLLINKVL